MCKEEIYFITMMKPNALVEVIQEELDFQGSFLDLARIFKNNVLEIFYDTVF